MALSAYKPSTILDVDNYWQAQERSRELILGNRYQQYLQSIAQRPVVIDPIVLKPVLDELSSFSTSPGQEMRLWYREMLFTALQQLAPLLISSRQQTTLLKEQLAQRQLAIILRATWERLLPILERGINCPGLLTSERPESYGAPGSPTVAGQQLSAICQQKLLALPPERQVMSTHAAFYRRLLRYSGWSALLDKGARRAANLGAPRLANENWLAGVTACCYYYSQLLPQEIDQEQLTAELLSGAQETIIELSRCRTGGEIQDTWRRQQTIRMLKERRP